MVASAQFNKKTALDLAIALALAVTRKTFVVLARDLRRDRVVHAARNEPAPYLTRNCPMRPPSSWLAMWQWYINESVGLA